MNMDHQSLWWHAHRNKWLYHWFCAGTAVCRKGLDPAWNEKNVKYYDPFSIPRTVGAICEKCLEKWLR